MANERIMENCRATAPVEAGPKSERTNQMISNIENEAQGHRMTVASVAVRELALVKLRIKNRRKSTPEIYQ